MNFSEIKKSLILLIACISLFGTGWSQKSEFHFFAHEKPTEFPIDTKFYWSKIEQKNPRAILDEIDTFKSDAPIQLSNKDSILWVKFSHTSLEALKADYLIVPNCHINYLQVFYLNENKEIVDSCHLMGDRVAFSARAIPFPEFIVPMNIDKPFSDVLIFLDKSNEPFYTSIQAADSNEMEYRKRNFFLLSGTIIGILLAAFLLNLYIVLNTQSIINYLYSIFLALCIIYTLSDFGYLHWIINYNSHWTIDIIRPLSLSLAFPTYLFFLLHTLSLSDYHPIASRRIKIYTWIWLGYVIIAAAISPFLYDHSYKYYSLSISMLFQQVTLIIVIWGCYQSIKRKDKFAVPFLITSILFIVAHIQHWNHQYGKIDDSVTNQHFLPIILAIDCLLIGAIVTIKFINFIQDNKILQLQLFNKDAEINERITEIQLRELSRISQLLHNHIGVELMSLNSTITAQKEALSADLYNVLRNKTNDLIEDVRNTAHFLSPQILKKFGLSHCIQLFVHDVSKSKNIACYTEISKECDAIPLSTQLIVMLTIQECVNNTIKHADAHQIQIQCFVDNGFLFISYSDDGKGFEIEQIPTSGLGLMQVQEMITVSKGQVHFQSSLGEGFQLEANLPFHP
jgi:signal transduction histidine kinase